jgi:hypothetical protein
MDSASGSRRLGGRWPSACVMAAIDCRSSTASSGPGDRLAGSRPSIATVGGRGLRLRFRTTPDPSTPRHRACSSDIHAYLGHRSGPIRWGSNRCAAPISSTSICPRRSATLGGCLVWAYAIGMTDATRSVTACLPSATSCGQREDRLRAGSRAGWPDLPCHAQVAGAAERQDGVPVEHGAGPDRRFRLSDHGRRPGFPAGRERALCRRDRQGCIRRVGRTQHPGVGQVLEGEPTEGARDGLARGLAG